MAELKPAPELVEPATDDAPATVGDTPDPAPDDGQLASESEPEPTPPQTYKIGDEEYDSETLLDYIDTAKNAKTMHRTAHEKYAAANEAYEKAMATQNDPRLKKLGFLLETIEKNPEVAQAYNRLESTVFGDGPPGSSAEANLRMAARLEQLESRLNEVSEEKALVMADDYLGKFAKDHEMSEDEAEAFAQDFLAKTKAEDFPADADIAQQLEFHYWRTQGGTLQQQVEAAKKAGYEAALAKIRAGQGAELGSPAQRSEVPWTPPKDANTRPMDASFKAAMEDEEIRFDDVSLT